MTVLLLAVFTVVSSVFDAVILYIYLNKILGARKEWAAPWLYFSSFVLCEGGLYFLSYYFENAHSDIRIYVTMAFSLATTFALACFHRSLLRHRIFVVLSFQIYAALAEVVVYILFSSLPGTLPETLLSADYYGSFCSKVVLFWLLNVTILLWRRKKQNTSLPYNVLVLIMPLFTLAILMTFSFQTDMTPMQAVLQLIGMSGILFANVTNYILLDNVLKVEELNLAKQQLNRQLEYQAAKYQQISTVYRNSRRLIHDMKKHFFFIENCLDNGEYDTIGSYIQESLQDIEQTHNRINTGNLVIDAFVSSHMAMAEQENIEFFSDIQVFNDNIEIDNYDFSIVLGNLLDNSLDACRKIQSPSPRRIAVQIFTTNMEFVIHIDNTIAHHAPAADESAQELYHGFGMKNIENIVKKYMGTYTHYIEREHYHSIVSIPCHVERRTAP